ncbi:MAG: 50S ribosomal protein L18 [Kiritimatiellae bacterium]|nr:50S ribosomal protein L18 [Kiritimatiellia bacterium]MDW8457495.1 50S ribosomal protein L18 [Verrucomicrobiota bacterium]
MRVRTKQDYRKRRHLRLRQKVVGTPERPRMSVYVSNRHLYVQFIDDSSGRTLAQCSTLAAEFDGAKLNRETAQKLGRLAAQAALEKGITRVVFDRGGFTYGGRIRALADAAREAGLQF